MLPEDSAPGPVPNLPARAMPRPTAQVEPFVRALGAVDAVAFLLNFGGAELHVPKTPGGGGMVERQMGREVALKLSLAADTLPRRVPLAKPWLAQVLQWQGYSVAAIARTLRVSDQSVRGWLAKRQDGAAPIRRAKREV